VLSPGRHDSEEDLRRRIHTNQTRAVRHISTPGRPPAPRSAQLALLALESGLALATGYLLTLLLAAQDQRRRTRADAPARAGGGPRFVVLIPAHDEQEGIAATLGSLASCAYPAELLRAIVIADNCGDSTAERARRAGVEVWERQDEARRGKGFALIWALERLLRERDDFDAVVVLDADCLVSPNMLAAMSARIGAGARAVQVRYDVQNPDASSVSALRYAAFALMCTVRPMGKQRLGLSCGLLGTGMAFTRDLLAAMPWTATGLVEDAEYHMRLVDAGERAQFASEAWVSSAMPTSFRDASDQQARWEQGRLQMIRRWSPRLLAAGLANRDLVRLHAGLEHLVPPQSLIAAASSGSAIAAALLGSKRLCRLSLSTSAAQLAFVAGGLRLVGAPRGVYRALLAAPALVVRKLALYAGLIAGRGPSTWVRTARS
jgi:1,2-diacylglycerol 3-beta-glucosyltransferase